MEIHLPSRTHEPDQPGFGGKLKCFFVGLAVLTGLFAAGCTQGAYPVDIFYEMHYQQSYKSQEPPSLSAPADSVAWFPPTQSTAFNNGRHLYTINCSMCHGTDAKGTGPVLKKLVETYGYTPLVSPDLTILPPESIEVFLRAFSRPFGPDSIMPPFGRLLGAEERLAISEYIGTLPK